MKKEEGCEWQGLYVSRGKYELFLIKNFPINVFTIALNLGYTSVKLDIESVKDIPKIAQLGV